jgi:hypothetical protein
MWNYTVSIRHQFWSPNIFRRKNYVELHKKPGADILSAPDFTDGKI